MVQIEELCIHNIMNFRFCCLSHDRTAISSLYVKMLQDRLKFAFEMRILSGFEGTLLCHAIPSLKGGVGGEDDFFCFLSLVPSLNRRFLDGTFFNILLDVCDYCSFFSLFRVTQFLNDKMAFKWISNT